MRKALNNHLDYFDGIRGLAVCIVWLSHSSGRGMSISDFMQFDGIGHIGVMLFFVLSGFLLSSSVMHEKYTYKSYLIRRFFRIAPLYYIILICLYFYQTYMGSSDLKYLHMDTGYISLVKHLVFLKGDGVFWTIPVEFMFYFILPFIVLLILKNKNWIWFFAGVSMIYSVYHFLIYSGHSTFVPLKLVEITHHSQFLSLFVVGVIMGVMSKNTRIINLYLKDENKYNVLINSMFFVWLIISFLFVAKSLFGAHQPLYLMRFMSFAYAVIFGIVLFSLANGNEFLRRLFMNRILVFMGQVGFSWYLLHMLILELVNSYMLYPWLKFIVATILITLLSYISFKVIEEPFMRLGKKIST